MSEWTNAEITRALQTLTESVKELTLSVESVRDAHPNFKDLEIRLKPIELRSENDREDIRELQDAQKWILRIVLAAVVTAVLSIVVAAPPLLR